MKIYNSVFELVGNTPLLELTNFEQKIASTAKIYAKVEFFNPAGSVKDRVAREMIEKYEKDGKLTRNSTLIEATSGNTGIGLAALCAARGYKLIIVMPDTMSAELRALMSAYGAELVLTDGALGMQGAIMKAEELEKSIPDSMIVGQFTNPSNPEAHYKTTGPEIWRDTDGKVDILVACVGTGGTLSGTGRFLKDQSPNVEIMAVEPAASPYLSEGRAGSHKIQGIGAGFLPETLDMSVIDQVITVTDDEAYESARDIATSDGLLVGISSGAALAAARMIATSTENKGKNIVVILPDTGERYLSSGLFEKKEEVK